MIIDDQFNLVYEEDSDEADIVIQQKPLKILKQFLEDNCIPFVPITDTDPKYVLNKIINYDNVRLLVLDLDLNDDGEVGEIDDIPLIIQILETALTRYGYFFLLVNSAHSEVWDTDINPKLLVNKSVFSKQNSSFKIIAKGNVKLENIFFELLENNFSLELIYDFECLLNRARDQAFYGLVDYEKRTWNRIYKQLLDETSSQSSFLLSGSFLTIIKQFLLNANYSDPEKIDPIDDRIAVEAFGQINYITNINENLSLHPKWTGNLYLIPNPEIDNLNYALIVTPECDLAQAKFINYQIVLGYEINELTFPSDYDHLKHETNPNSMHAIKGGKTKKGWRTKDNLSVNKGVIEHLYLLPFASQNTKTVVLDFRDLTFVNSATIDSWTLVKRVNDPMLTDIMDKLSLIFNRKGLLPILPSTLKIV